MSDKSIAPSDGFNYYVDTIYYTNFEYFLDRECFLITGHDKTSWHRSIYESYGKLGLAFVFGVGNGWVERSLYQIGLIDKVIGLDIVPKHILEARQKAAEIGLDAEYILADINTWEPPLNLRVNVVVNIGAMHHVAFINRLTRILSELCSGGIYISKDYTGAHRNQYSYEVWSKIIDLNSRLPVKYQTQVRYPHLKTMMVTDPSEAVHSELQMEVLLRHFDILKHVRLGGGLAHPLLVNNRRLFIERHTDEGRAALELIRREEDEALRLNPDFNLFTYFVAKPKTVVATNVQQLSWQAEENKREDLAASNHGLYGPPGILEIIYDQLANAEYQLSLK